MAKRVVKSKPLDGLHVWPTLSEGKPSPRTEVVYNVEPFRAGVREGDWRLVWRVILPSAVELYNIKDDPSEKTNLAAKYLDKVATLEKRANELASVMAKPMLLQAEFTAIRQRLAMPPPSPAKSSSSTKSSNRGISNLPGSNASKS